MKSVRHFYSKISLIEWLIGIWLAFLVFASSWSLFRPAFFRVHDYVHGARIAELVRSAQAGHLPVRWTENFGYGYGMPLFEFYAPLPYYIGGFVYWLSNDLVFASKLLFFIPNLGAVIGSYLLGKKLYGRKGGIIVATAFALAPYRAVNLFVRGAVSESWGMMAMPFVLWAGISYIESIKNKSQSLAWLTFCVSLVTLFLSHNLSTLMFVPVSFIFLTLVAWQRSSGNSFSVFLASVSKIFGLYLLSIGLSAFYLFPALLEKDFTIISSILSGYFFYSHHFLYIRQFLQPNWGYGGSAWGPDDGISFFLGYGQLLGLGISLVMVGWQLLKKITTAKKSSSQQIVKMISFALQTPHFQLFVLSGVVVIGALFLTLLKSEWLWSSLPLISYIQFPWRWLSVAALFLAIMAGYSAILIQSRRLLMLLVGSLLVILTLNMQYFQPESYLGQNADFYYSEPKLIRSEMSGVLPDYIPVGLKLAKLASPTDATQSSWLATNTDGTVVTTKTAELIPEFSIAVNRPHQKVIDFTLADQATIEFAVAYYPGWRAEIDGKETQIQPSETGLIGVTVPAGKHSVGIEFGSTPVRFWSDIVSLLSLLFVLYLLTPSITSKRK